MDSSILQGATITDVTNSNLNSNQQIPDPLICGTSSETPVLQQTTILPYENASSSNVLQYSNKLYDAQPSNLNSLNINRNNNIRVQQSQMQTQNQMLNQNTNFMNTAADQSTLQTSNAEMLSNLSGAKKRQQIKGLRAQFGKREPHNYDKTAPTQHQTNLYNQIVSQQNRNQLQMQQQELTNSMTSVSSTPIYNSTNYLGGQNIQTHIHIPPIQTTTNSYINALNLSASNNYNNLPQNQLNQNMMNIISNQTQQAIQSQTSSIKSNSNLLSLLSMKTPVSSPETDASSQMDTFKASTSTHPTSYKPYPMQQTLKTNSFNQMQQRNMQMSSGGMSHHMNPLINDRQQQQINANVSSIDKEMFRSKSLPMNSTLPLQAMRDEPFAVRSIKKIILLFFESNFSSK